MAASKPSIPTFPLNDGTKIPIIAFGTGTALYNQSATDYANQALELGFNHLDAAQMYNNETSLGASIAAHDRSKLYVTTKLGKIPPGKTIKDTLVKSLKDLQLDHVDLFLIHSPKLLADVGIAGAWKQMEDCQKEGLTKSIGVSNFRPVELEELLEKAEVIPAVNQIEYHPYVAAAAAPLISLHKKHNIVTAAYGGLSPLIRAPGGPVDAVVTKIHDRMAASGGEVTNGQVLLKWLETQGVVAVTTTSKASRASEYLATASLPPLTPEEVEEIRKAGAGHHSRHFMKHMDE